VIEVSSVSKVYGKKQHEFVALKDVNLKIEKGLSVAIIGKSGSGKSTLMHVMSGLDHPKTGSVIVDGQNIFTLKQKQIDTFRAEKIGFIFQSFFLEGNETVADNVSLPLEIAHVPRSQRSQRITDALTAVELEDKAKNKARNLSGGQRQRLVIARAIVNDPSIIFADEPTGNLDSQTGEKIEDLLFGLNKKNGATLVIVTHDDDLAAKCDVQVRIKDGEIQSIEYADNKVAQQQVEKGNK
jgi:putative ABC transport system ATP-binding protein